MGGVDFKSFNEIFSFFEKRKLFVIKSTVPPGTVDGFQKQFPQHLFFHNPEFLSEATAWQDFLKPVFQIIGYTKKNKRHAPRILTMLPSAKNAAIIPAIESEIFKYARNAFFAGKVVFANAIYDLCTAVGADYGEIKKLMSLDPWIGGNHLDIFHGGYRGFGGKCLPKDLKILICTYKITRQNPAFFEAVHRTNERLKKLNA